MAKHERASQAEGDVDTPGTPPEKKQKKVDSSHEEEADSTTSSPAEASLPQHFKMYKPPRVLCQFIHTARRRKKRKLLGDHYDFPSGTMAIGRLDEDSEGLLLLTTDGKTSERVRDKSVEKEYYAQVDGQITEEAVEKIKRGIEISVKGETYNTLPCEARILKCDNANNGGLPPNIPEPVRRIRDDRHGPTSWVSVTVTEGKFRQVRKMTAVVGFPTLRLVRVRVADIELDGLAMGEVRRVDIDI